MGGTLKVCVTRVLYVLEDLKRLNIFKFVLREALGVPFINLFKLRNNHVITVRASSNVRGLGTICGPVTV